MAGATSATSLEPGVAEPRVSRRRPLRYGTIVVCGGGCYGSYYVRQLGRAAASGALEWRALIVVDRDPNCRVARELALPAARIVCAPWTEFFAAYFENAGRSPAESADDAIVPSPLMPHLMFEWLRDRARARWPGRKVEPRPLPSPLTIPWQRAAPDGTHYVSFAEWTCPVNCIEPSRCPVTRGARDWSMPPAIRAYVEELRDAETAIAGPLLFHCTHRAYGVGMIDTRDVLAADALVLSLGTAGPANVLIGTVSHCHGALTLLSVGAESSA